MIYTVSEQSSLEQAYLKVHRLSKHYIFSVLIVSFHFCHGGSHFLVSKTGFSILQGRKEVVWNVGGQKKGSRFKKKIN